MTDEDLLITKEEEDKALRECVQLGYMMRNDDGKIVMTAASMKRVEGMVWVSEHPKRQPPGG